MVATPPGGWGGAALTGFAAAARAQAEIIAQQIETQEKPKVSIPCEQCRYKDASLVNREEVISKLNATIDDQAAQIVAFQATLGVNQRPLVTQTGDIFKRLQASDDTMRKNLERAEARVAQLLGWAREHELDIPAEAAYYTGGPAATGPKF